MKTLITITLASALFIGRALPAQAETEATTPAPSISFKETVYNAGDSWEGEIVSHAFSFTNTGDAELKISRVRSSCGCTASNLSSDTIAPGESGEIRASFNTRHYQGQKSQPVYVTSNDPTNPNVQLQLVTTVKTIASFDPANLQFDQVIYGQGATRETTLVFDGEPFPIREISVEPEFFQARILEPEEETGNDSPIRIEVTLSPEAPIGHQRGTLTARIDHPQSPEVTARVMASVEGIITYTPRMIFFSNQDQEEQAVKIVTLTNNGDQPIAIREVSCGIPQFQAEVKTIQPGKQFEVEVRLMTEIEPERYSTELTIETDLAAQEQISIPLRANLLP